MKGAHPVAAPAKLKAPPGHSLGSGAARNFIVREVQRMHGLGRVLGQLRGSSIMAPQKRTWLTKRTPLHKEKLAI